VGYSADFYRRRNEGMDEFPYPFLDWDYLGAGADCWKRGINVYISDPCDVLRRPHAYSPLWLRASFLPTGRLSTSLGGIALDCCFFLSLYFTFKPVNWREVVVSGLAALSTMVVYGLERGNADVILFVMLVAAGVLATGPLLGRIGSYALLLVAGLLKFYPIIGLLIALRERPRMLFRVGFVAAGIFLAFLYHYRLEIVLMRANIPVGGLDANMFAASNLPTGLADVMGHFVPALRQPPLLPGIQMSFSVVLAIGLGMQVIRLCRNAAFTEAFSRLSEHDRIFFTLGSVLIAGCFVTGPSIEYRGVYLLFFIVGLIAMSRSTDDPAMRAKLVRLICMVVFLMWGGFFRRLVGPKSVLLVFLPQGVDWPLHLFRLGREVLWWYMVAFMLGVVIVFTVQSTTFATLFRPRGSTLPSATG
jgi:hypothetical protein